MKIMKLHLYQSVPYLCASREWSFLYLEQSLSVLKSLCTASDAAWYEPELLFCISSDNPRNLQNAFLFGTGPASDVSQIPPEGFSIHVLESGDYLFTQFSGNSPENISDAVSASWEALSAKGLNAAGGSWYLRGIQKGEHFSLQILIPFSS